MMDNNKLSKRQKKALAFRERKGGNLKETQSDENPVAETNGAENKSSWLGKDTPAKSSPKKRKRTDDGTGHKVINSEPLQSTGPPQKKNKKGTDPSKDYPSSPPSKKQKTKEPTTKRFVVFVGNLPHKPSSDLLPDLKSHFPTPPTSIRIPTKKSTNAPQGFAFVEFDTATDLEKALRCHHTIFLGRKINIELTAGGGGRGENRMEKIKKRNETLAEERRKRILEEEAEKKEKEKGKGPVDGIHPSRLKLMKKGQKQPK